MEVPGINSLYHDSKWEALLYPWENFRDWWSLEYTEYTEAAIIILSPFNLPVWPVQRVFREWLDYCKLCWTVTPIAAAISDRVSLLEQLSIALGIWLSYCLFLHTNVEIPPKTFCFYLQGPTVHFHSLASELNRLSCFLPLYSPKIMWSSWYSTKHHSGALQWRQADCIWLTGSSKFNMWMRGWEINSTTFQRSAISVKFLKFQWCGIYWDILSKVKVKLLNLTPPLLKKEAQHLVGFSVFGGNACHIYVCYFDTSIVCIKLSVLCGDHSKRRFYSK